MEIKGNIGEEIYVKAKIKSINVDQDGTRYFLYIEYEDTKGLDSSEILFNAEPEKAAEEVPEEVVEGVAEEVAEEVVETPPKRRGRPRKATVDDLMKKAKASDNS